VYRNCCKLVVCRVMLSIHYLCRSSVFCQYRALFIEAFVKSPILKISGFVGGMAGGEAAHHTPISLPLSPLLAGEQGTGG